MKRGRSLLLALCLLFTTLFAGMSVTEHTYEVSAATTNQKPKNTFVKKNGKWYYYDSNGKLAKGWFVSKGGNRYYFGKDGAARAGILTISGKKYCFNEKGKMQKEWQTVNGKTYFFDEKDGHMHTGWTVTKAGNRYYFGKDGVIRPGWQTVDKKTYYFTEKGKMVKNAFLTVNKQKFYLDKNGQKYKGRHKIKNIWYAFHRTTGVLVTGGWYKETDGSYYYASQNGKLVSGFYKPDSYYRYFRPSDCKMLTGWQKIGDWKYYFKKKNGLRYDDCKLTLSGKMYYFSKTGKLYEKKWFTKTEGTYYAKKDGVLATGWLTLSGKTYYLDSKTGVRKTGWVTVGEDDYYLDPKTGVLRVNSWIDKDHYVGQNGAYIPGYSNQSFRWPLSSNWNYISSYFGNRESPGGIGSTNHGGIDIPAPQGTPIYAVSDGTVVAIQKPSQSGGAGNYTMINHGKGIISEYMHQSKFATGLKVGQKVKRGQVIGYVGSTGNSTGAHLHLGFVVNGKRRDPLNYVKQP